MRLSARRTSLLVLCLTTLTFVAPSMAGERHDHRFEHHHPRRDQVLDRTQVQNRRITREVREGDLTHAQAHALRLTDRSVSLQQRADTKANGGYITKQEQRALDRELNANSKL